MEAVVIYSAFGKEVCGLCGIIYFHLLGGYMNPVVTYTAFGEKDVWMLWW